MENYYYNLTAYERAKKEIEYYESVLEKLPGGSLITSKRKQGVAYYQNIDHKKIYIPAANKTLAEQLAYKTYVKKKLSDAKNEKDALERYIERHKDSSADRFILNNSRFLDLIKNGGFFDVSAIGTPSGSKEEKYFANSDWTNKVAANPEAYKLLCDHIIYNGDGSKYWNYEGSNLAPYQEKRDTNTLCGIKVRSKSEAIIADSLFHANILFLYEPRYHIDGQYYYPDFFIFHPIDGNGIILEHGGMFLDRVNLLKYDENEKQAAQNYTYAFSRKIQKYISDGWVPGVNLLITGETKFKKINPSIVRAMINEHLLS